VTQLDPGAQAPDFSLEQDRGEPISLADLRGRKVALYFYPRDDTPGCTTQATSFNALLTEFEATECEVVGVSGDSPASHARFRAKHALAFPLASDPAGEILNAYGVFAEKRMYGRVFTGIERTTFLIDREGKVAQVWRKVKVAGHAASVLEAAQGLA